MRTPISQLIPAMEAVLQEKDRPHSDPDMDAYFAGHFDGEGCISFQREKSGGNPGLTARVSSVYKPTILEYRSYFGGSVNPVGQKDIANGKSCRLQWQWHLSDMVGLLRFVLKMIPHAHEKRSQLELGRDYLLERLRLFKLGNTKPPERVHEMADRLSEMKQFEYQIKDIELS